MNYLDGLTDEDHLCAAAWNLMCAMWTEEKMPWLQDIPSRQEPKGCAECDARHCCPEGEKAVDAGEPLQLDNRIEMAIDNLKVVLALAPKAVMNDEEYWRGFNNGICRALIELGVGIEQIGNLIK